MNLPLIIVENDSHVRIHCAATPEQNHGEACMWSWTLNGNEDDHARQANGKALNAAIHHALTRHC